MIDVLAKLQTRIEKLIDAQERQQAQLGEAWTELWSACHAVGHPASSARTCTAPGVQDLVSRHELAANRLRHLHSMYCEASRAVDLLEQAAWEAEQEKDNLIGHAQLTPQENYDIENPPMRDDPMEFER